MEPRGLRNFNPGNIVDGKFAKSMPGYAGSDGRFARFDSMDAGAHAMQRLLEQYGRKGRNTVTAIIGRWAPPSENDTNAYANTVARKLGVKPNAKLDMTNPATVAKLSSAMAEVENGRPVKLSYVGQPSRKASDAVNRLAEVPTRKVQTVNFVPPPFSDGQAQFEPLPAFRNQAAPVYNQPVERMPLAEPQKPAPATEADDDILRQWGLGGSEAKQEPSANPDDELLKQWGLGEERAEPEKAAEPEVEKTFGQRAGDVIDAGLDVADRVASPVASFTNDVVRQVATGVPVLGGAANRLNAATNAAIAPAVNPFLSEENQLKGGTWSERYANSLAAQEGMDAEFQAAHPIISTGAQLAGGVASVGGVLKAAPAAGKLLGVTGNSMLGRTVAGGLSGAALGAGDAAVRSGGDPTAIKEGAIIGGALGAGAPAAGKAIGATVNKLVGGVVPKRVAELAKLARDKYGVDITPGQLSTNPSIKFLDSVVNRLPLSGGTAAKEVQQRAFNKAVANSFGETAEELSPEVMASAKSRIGQTFESVAERTPQIRADQNLVDDFARIAGEAEQTLAPGEIAVLNKQLDNVMGKFADDVIDGRTYQALTRKGSPLDRAQQSNDPNIRFYAGQIREALDGALERSAPADVLEDLQLARRQWKAMKTVEPLAEKGATGDVSPALLMNAARQSYGGMAYGQGSDLVDLARIGQQFLKEAPSSGTAERTWMHNLLIGGGAGGGAAGLALNPGAIPFAVGGALGSAALARGTAALLRNKTIANRMIEGGIGDRAAPNMLLRGAPQGVIPQANRQPLEITVTPRR